MGSYLGLCIHHGLGLPPQSRLPINHVPRSIEGLRSTSSGHFMKSERRLRGLKALTIDEGCKLVLTARPKTAYPTSAQSRRV